MPSKRLSASTKRPAAQTKRVATPVRRPSRFRFISETIAEMKKVTWLTRREAVYLSGLVLIVAITVGVILGLLDLGLSSLVNTFLLGG